MIVTTTNFIENAKIEQYLGIVTANCVVGTNFISDFTASLTDFFGGMSGTYQRKLHVLYNAAMDTLKEDARRKGANAIVGLSIDFDEVSGKGKSMFMVSVIGTAVKIDDSKNQSVTLESEGLNSKEISRTTIENFIARVKLIHQIASLGDGEFPSEVTMKKIIELEIVEIADELCKKYIESNTVYTYATLGISFKEQYYQYISRIGYDNIIDSIYANLVAYPEIIGDLIKTHNLFNPQAVVSVIPSLKVEDVVNLIKSDKETYCHADIAPMEQIVDYFENLSDVGQISEVSGLLGGRSKKYICPEGHKNPEETKFCESCGKNIKGLTIDDINAITDFKVKVEFLKTNLN